METYMVKAQDVLDEIIVKMNRIARQPESGWLNAVYKEMSARLFPESFEVSEDAALNEAVDYFMARYSDALKDERAIRGYSPVDDFDFCTAEEIKHCDNADEYRRFLDAWEREHIYEYMRLAREVTAFNTVGHVAGVHHIATFIGRQIARYDSSTDIGIISASAACHDLGKFGCIGDELNKVAHYHYYYTTVICERLGLPMIAHIAGNHSTWDLELENLSVESLVMIYSDFRVRSHREDGVETITFHTLEESFNIILSKLENVDEAKRHRYEKVYMKLQDFEAYLRSLGIETDPAKGPAEEVKEEPNRDPLLMGNEVTDRLKHLAFWHNIKIMSIFNNEAAFGTLLENARTENNSSRIRAYLNILDEYSQYMTTNEKLITLRFLYDQLSNREGDIRRRAAETMGKLIANYRTPATKLRPERAGEVADDSLLVWKRYLHRILYPGHRVTDQHRRWIRYIFKLVFRTLVKHADPARVHSFIEVYLDAFNEEELSEEAAFALMDAAQNISYSYYTDEDMITLSELLLRYSRDCSFESKAIALKTVEIVSRVEDNSDAVRNLLRKALDNLASWEHDISCQYIYQKTLRNLEGNGRTDRELLAMLTSDNPEPTSKLMRDNLKTATPWVIKTINIEFLHDYVLNVQDGGRNFFLASHLSNLLKVSEQVTVRRLAGKRLVSLSDYLTKEQINELVIELTRGLEIGDYQFSKYIPEYLGRLSLKLSPNELDEFIDELGKMLVSDNYRIASVALDTVGEILQHCQSYSYRETADESGLVEREKFMLGLLLKGLANFNEEVSRKAIYVTGRVVFGSNLLKLKDKLLYYRYIYKKLLTLINRTEESDINFYNNAAALNNIYRFITDYNLDNGSIDLPENNRIAFFPGTFDPFSSGHKGIVDAIRAEGFETYLALDEFSWSKNTQPRMMRRDIIAMSTASDPGVFLFLDDFPVNIANPQNIRTLKSIFRGKEIYMVAGSDVIINASSYKAAPTEDSIHTLNHIIFRRESAENGDESHDKLQEAYRNIKGKIHELMLPTYLEDISSTQIRDNIDDGRDISRLIDPVAQSYIYANGMYLREPMYKSALETRHISLDVDQRATDEFISSLSSRLAGDEDKLESLKDYLAQEGVSYTSISTESGIVSGLVCYHSIDMAEIFREFNDFDIAQHIRDLSPGRMLVIRGIYVDALTAGSNSEARKTLNIIMTEVLAGACKAGITYGLYHALDAESSEEAIRALQRSGWKPIDMETGSKEIYAVDMNSPIILIENMDTVIKSPFNTNAAITDALEKAHRRLQMAITRLEPGNLVLSFNAGIINRRIVKMVTEANGVPDTPTVPRKLGASMCVPFGKTLGSTVIPNTVTKTLHTEKKYTAALDRFSIKEYPNYSTLENQVKTIKSFNRPVMLVDDLLHKGYRLKHLDPILNDNSIAIERIIVGVLSGRGKDLMDLQGRTVESAYFLPNMKSWFVESGLYPFIGGDSVESNEQTHANLITSINLVPPFAAPGFLYDYDRTAAYDLAITCLENTREIFHVLEEEYLKHFERQLTIRRLSDVIKQPRKPVGSNISVEDLSRLPSSYMDDYIDRLKRLKTAMQ